MGTLFSKMFFCRKLYVVQGRRPAERAFRRLKTQAQGTAEENFNDEDAAGSHGSKQHSGMSGASCNFVQSVGRAYAELKAVVRVYRSLFCLSVEKERFGYGS